jgi:probable aminopeptidase NPEPL1
VAAHLPAEAAALLPALVEAVSPGDDGGATTTFLATEHPRRVVVCVLPEGASRHNSPARPHAIAALLGRHVPNLPQVSVLLCLDAAEHAFAAGSAVARAWGVYTRKTGPAKDRAVHVAFLAADAPVPAGVLAAVGRAAEGIRLACRLVEMPHGRAAHGCVRRRSPRGRRAPGRAAHLHPGHRPERARLRRPLGHRQGGHSPAGAGGAQPHARGREAERRLGGQGHRLRHGRPEPEGQDGHARHEVATWAARRPCSRPSRRPCAGGFPDALHAVLCLAENAIGPEAVRNDDVLTLYSGKTVEVNNTDAEGRLVLADGIAYGSKPLSTARSTA